MHNLIKTMQDYLQLNKKFLIKNYFWLSGILTTGFLFYLIFFYKEVSFYWIVIVLLLTILLLPFFVLSVWTYDWYRKRNYINRIIKQYPYSALEKIGFTKKTILPNHVGLMDYVPFGEINGIQIVLNVDIHKPNVVEFTIYCSTSNLNSQQFSEKFNELKYTNIALNFTSLTKKIDVKSQNISIQNLEMILTELTHIVKINKFEPIVISACEND